MSKEEAITGIVTNGDYLGDLRTIASFDLTPLKLTLGHMFRLAEIVRSNPKAFDDTSILFAELVNNMSMVIRKKSL